MEADDNVIREGVEGGLVGRGSQGLSQMGRDEEREELKVLVRVYAKIWTW